MKASLRPACVEDLAAIAAVHVAAGQAAWDDIAPVAEMVARPEEWAPRLEAASGALVAVEGDEVVGFAFAGACELQYFFTHPRVWGFGVGRQLLAAAEEALRAAGCSDATLWTEERNHRPLRVYAAAGWLPDGEVRERDWLGVRIRELRLGKRL